VGIRGITSKEKYIVNVNGVNTNITPHGAILELLNWELSDIDHIEVVRGPGSVTYGPGAISAVINIFTKKAKQAPGVQLGGAYWGRYNAVGNWVSYGRAKDDFELYTYFSAVDVRGFRNPKYFFADKSGGANNNRKYNAGYIGTAGIGGSGVTLKSGAPASTYMGNYYNEPEIKAHLDIRFNENWRFWGRYVTESSQYTLNNNTQWLIDGKYQDLRQQRYRYFQLALENQHTINKDWELKSTFGMSSADVRIINEQNSNIPAPGKDNLLNYGKIYSEWKYYSQFMLHYKPEDSRLKGALGFEISYDLIRPGWGKNKDNGLRIDGLMSGPSSDAYGTGQNQYTEADTGEYYAVGNGWETITHAFIGELNYEFTPKTTMILSARMDKHSYTDYSLSPRLAFIYEPKKDEYLKFIVQRSVRINTAEELYMNRENKTENTPEELESFELIYSKKVNDRFSYQGSVFWNKLEAIGWDSVSKSSCPVGTLELFGLEIEAKYKKDNFELGINHSIVKQLNWKLADGISKSSFSYSDYYAETDYAGVAVRSNGNDLSNWANQATKLYTNIDLLEKKVTLHGDIRAFWGFEGEAKGLDAVESAAESSGNSTVKARRRATIDEVRKKGAYGILATANVSLTYHINKSADVSMFVQNIPVVGNNKRYAHSSGQKDEYPSKSSWVEEPTIVGVKYKIRF
jgi:outer membrane receptor protein involved in Fe transport